jgi:hypothetical protein
VEKEVLFGYQIDILKLKERKVQRLSKTSFGLKLIKG